MGGSNQESSNFSQAIATEDSIVRLTEVIVDIVHQNGFDGIDVAWFNPGESGDFKADRVNLVRFLHELRVQLSPGASLSVTAALNPELYDVRSIDVFVDFVSLLTVDYHDLLNPSHVAPLYYKDKADPSSVVST